MPIMQEQGLWEKSGRWATYQISRTMLTVTDRGGQVFGLAPTAEEVVTDYAASVVKSYKQLPVTFFQQHTKFRDEIRPRFGLMRVKEFIMMDAYSFHDSEASLDATYEAMRVAYQRAFARLGLEAFAVEADSGAIGGSGSHEFMVAAAVGEDAILFCTSCGYAANVERAISRLPEVPAWNGPQAASAVHTPQAGAIAEVVALLRRSGHPQLHERQLLKMVLLVASVEGGRTVTVAAAVPGDRQVNEVKLANALTRLLKERGPVLALRPMQPEEVTRATAAAPGFAGPLPGLAVDMLIIDRSVPRDQPLVVGANRTDYHIVGHVLARDSASLAAHAEDILSAAAGDGCPRCTATLELKRGIEVGHIFKLGTKYSLAMHAEFTGQDQKLHAFIMGCYGIGTSRVVAAAVEQHHDADGMRWPMAIAPYQVVVVPVGKPGDAAVEAAAVRIYDELRAAGVEAVLDDRDLKPGVKFKDWDLIGIPLRVVAGRGVAEGLVEFKARGAAAENLPLAEAGSRVAGLVREALRPAAAAR
jgi:prolyl-tRNA synthetase